MIWRNDWIELPPIQSQVCPKRLLVFLPGGQSSADSFAPVAVAWQLKFPSASCMIMQPPVRSALWWESHQHRRHAAPACAVEVSKLIRHRQDQLMLDASQTIVVAFAQGATVAIELARRTKHELVHRGESNCHDKSLHQDLQDAINSKPVCSMVVAYAAQLARPLLAHEYLSCSIHLIHGDLDHQVPSSYGFQAFRSLKAAGAEVTWDLLADAVHTIGQDAVIVGTMRAMQSIFRGRRKGVAPTLH